MAQLFMCPHGHSWEGDAERGKACPSCGETGEAVHADEATEHGAGIFGDELPPPPAASSRMGTPLTTAPNVVPVVAGYEILGELGRGGMGIVYKATQLSLSRVVALKVISASLHASPEAFARFRAEAHTVARFKHPNIVHIYDVVEVDGRPCFAMEYVEGGALDQHLGGKPMPAEQAAQLVRMLARAVQAAHEHGIIHRDLKPANILLAPLADAGDGMGVKGIGTPKITDFGLAKRLDQEGVNSRAGYIMGTPHYMAPEQAEGDTKRIGPATDIYALGAILYEALTGRPPFRGDNASAILKQVLFDEPNPPARLQPDIPPRLETICLKCLCKDPAKRYASAAALADELEQYLTDAGQAGAWLVVPARPPAWRSRRAWTTAGVLILFFATMLAFVPEVRRWVVERFLGVEVVDDPKPIVVQWQMLPGPAKEKGEAFDRIAFPTESIGYLASRRGIYKTLDAGDTWQKLKVDPPGRVHVLRFVDDQTGWLATDKLRHTADGGATWTDVALGNVKMRAVTAFAVDSNGLALAGGATEAGALVLFDNAGTKAKWERLKLTGDLEKYEKWSLVSLALNEAVSLAVLSDPDQGGGVVLRKLAGTAPWKRVLTTEDDLYRVHLNSKGEVWLTGLGGKLWHSSDGGATFDAPTNPDSDRATPACVTFDPSNRLGLAPLWKGKLLVKVDTEPWIIQQTPLGYSLADAVVVSTRCAYVLGTDGRIARFFESERE